MSIYVDDVRHAYGRMVMCHMWADSLEELLLMADRIGVKRKWIQGHPTLSIGKARDASFVHFDVSLGAKQKAMSYGAILTDQFGPSEFCAKLNIASGDPERVSRGEAMLSMIASSRLRRLEA